MQHVHSSRKDELTGASRAGPPSRISTFPIVADVKFVSADPCFEYGPGRPRLHASFQTVVPNAQLQFSTYPATAREAGAKGFSSVHGLLKQKRACVRDADIACLSPPPGFSLC